MPETEVKSTPKPKKNWIDNTVVDVVLAVVGGTAIVTAAYFIGKSRGDTSFEITIYPESEGGGDILHLFGTTKTED